MLTMLTYLLRSCLGVHVLPNDGELREDEGQREVLSKGDRELDPRDERPVRHQQPRRQHAGRPRARQRPRGRKQNGEEEPLQRENALQLCLDSATETSITRAILTYLDVEKDGLQPEIIDGIGGGDEELLPGNVLVDDL